MAVELTPDPRELCASLARAGERVVSLSNAVDEPSFHDRIAAALAFPPHYGRNLDALWDCLTDLPAPVTLVWWDWPAVAVGHPQWWARVIGVLTDWAGRPGCRLILPTAGSD